MPSENQRLESAERRIAALEDELSAVRRTLSNLPREAPTTSLNEPAPTQAPTPVATPTPAPAPPAYLTPQTVATAEKSGFIPDAFIQQFGSSEFWINKAGIGLLLLGVIFLFKYSIDQGWITPAIRVMCGMGLGAALALVGVRIYDKKRHQSLVALGGSVATFYICGFAMFSMYNLVPHSVAFLLLGFVSALAFTFSIKQNEPVLSFIAALGAFLAPFLLYTGENNVPGLMLYTSLVIVSSCSVYIARGWVSLLTLSALCGWAVMLITAESPLNGQSDQIAAQSGIALSWLLFWGSPLARLSLLSKERLPRWLTTNATPETALRLSPTKSLPGHAHSLTIISPVIALALSMPIWSLAETSWSLISAGISIVYFVMWLRIRQLELFKDLSTTQMIAGFLMLTAASITLLDDTTTPAFIGAQALALRVVSRQLADKSASSVKNWSLVYLFCSVFWVGMGLMFGSLFDGSSRSVLSTETLVTLWIVVVTFGVSYLSDTKEWRIALVIIGASILALVGLDVKDSNGLFFAVTLVGMAIVAGGQKLRKESLYNIGNGIYLALAGWLYFRLVDLEPIGAPLINLQAGVEGLAILSGFALSRFVTKHRFSVGYGLIAHVAFLALIFREFVPLENGHGIITSIWSAYTIALIILSLRLRDSNLKKVSTATLALVIGKLFLVDLGNLESLWRILIFIGLGGLLMAVSYFYQRIWNSADSADPAEPREP